MKRPTITVFALILGPVVNDGFIFQTSQHIQPIHNKQDRFDSNPSILRIQHHWNSRRDVGGGIQPRRHGPTSSRLFTAEAPSSGGESKITSAKVQEMASFLAIQLLERTLMAGLETQDKEETTPSPQQTVADKPTSKKDGDDDDFESLFEEPTTPTDTTKSAAEEEESSSDPLVEAKTVDPAIQSTDDLEAAILDEVYDLEEGDKIIAAEKNADEVAPSPPPPSSSPPLEGKSDAPESSIDETSPTDSEESTIAAILGEDLVPDIISKDFGKPLNVVMSNVPPLRESSIPKKKPMNSAASSNEDSSTGVDTTSSSSEETTLQTSDNDDVDSSDSANIETASQETDKEVEADEESPDDLTQEEPVSEVTTEKSDINDNEDKAALKINDIKEKQENARREMLSARLISEKRARIKQRALDESLKEAEAQEAALEAAMKIEEEARLADEEKAAEEARVKALEEERATQAKKEAEEAARVKALDEAKRKEEEKQARLKFEAEVKQKEVRAAQEKNEAEEAARLKALDEAKQKAIEKKEARIKFEEELKQKAEEKFLELKAEEDSRKTEAEQIKDSPVKEDKQSEQDAMEKEKLLNDEIEHVAEAAESMAGDGESDTPGHPDQDKGPKGKFVVPSSISNRRAAETIKALKQPKSEDEEKQLQEKYADMDVGDRAFAVLKDLGMIDISPDPKDPNYDNSQDDEDCDQFWLWG